MVRIAAVGGYGRVALLSARVVCVVHSWPAVGELKGVNGLGFMTRLRGPPPASGKSVMPCAQPDVEDWSVPSLPPHNDIVVGERTLQRLGP